MLHTNERRVWRNFLWGIRSFLTSAWLSRKESLLYKGDRYAMVQHLYKTNTLLGTSVWQILDGSEELSMSPLKHFQFWFQSLAPYYVAFQSGQNCLQFSWSKPVPNWSFLCSDFVKFLGHRISWSVSTPSQWQHFIPKFHAQNLFHSNGKIFILNPIPFE